MTQSSRTSSKAGIQPKEIILKLLMAADGQAMSTRDAIGTGTATKYAIDGSKLHVFASTSRNSECIERTSNTTPSATS